MDETTSTGTHHHHEGESRGVGSGIIVAVIFLVLLVVLLFYGLPYLRGNSSSTPQVNVPDQVDLNVNQK